METFSDRRQAGKLLAEAIVRVLDREEKDVIVLAIPRGGVIVANEVASALHSPMDLIITRKIGAPGNLELAVGAVTQDCEKVINHDLVRELEISQRYLEEEAARQAEEIKSRMRKYRGEKSYPNLGGKVVVIVDDGIATGYTTRAAIRSVRKSNPLSVILAIPVAPRDTVSELSSEVDQIVCLSKPEPFFAIGQFYDRFDQVADDEIRAIMKNYS